MRSILTFQTLHQVLAAEKALRNSGDPQLACRPTPTPPGLSQAICGMSLETLDIQSREKVLSFLDNHKLKPSGVFLIED